MKKKYKQLEKLYKNNLRCADYFGLSYCEDTQDWIKRVWKPWKFSYRNPDDSIMKNKKNLEYIKRLAIPPAWKNTYISPDKNTHILAQWEDSKKRKQYIYNEKWTQARRLINSYTLILFWEALWDIRSEYKRLIKSEKNSKNFTLWVFLFLLDETVIRVGNKKYFDDNGSVGISTLRCENLILKSGRLYLEFPWKSGKDHKVHIKNRRLKKVLLELCSWWEEFIFSYRDDDSMRTLTPEDINMHIKDLGCEVISAKDFRSWHASMIVFENFVEKLLPNTTEKKRKKIILESFDEASKKLWNTRTMIRHSYAHSDTVESARDASFRKIFNIIKNAKKLRNLTQRESQFLAFLKRLYEENIAFDE